MKQAIQKGFSFGLASGVITTLGLMVGLNSGTHSRAVVVGGILVIAIADALSDALGVHISEEYSNQEKEHSHQKIWLATICTFCSKFLFSLIFVIPVLIFNLDLAIKISVLLGFLIIAVFSFAMAKKQKVSAWAVVGEHLLIAVLVVFLTHLVGDWIKGWS